MRLWSLHPQYLDTKGLVALWRESLLAQAVLRGETRGYRNHPQLHRFRSHPSAMVAISFYLAAIYAEAERRGYVFDGSKIRGPTNPAILYVTDGQIAYEWSHLLQKLKSRSPEVYCKWCGITSPEPHPLFVVREGDVESWERTNQGHISDGRPRSAR